MCVMRQFVIIMFLMCCVFPSIKGFANDSADFDRRMKKADDLMFRTQRGAKELIQVLTIFKDLYQAEINKAKQDSSYTMSYTLLAQYIYAIYYNATYSYPQEDEPGGKRYIQLRLGLYKQADDIGNQLLKIMNTIPTDSEKAESKFVVALVKAEIAALSSSVYMLFKARSLLEEAQRLDPTVRNGAIYVTLGRLYAQTPRILFGNTSKALNYLKKAEDMPMPNIVAFYFEGEAIRDNEKFKNLEKEKQLDILNAYKSGLSWEQKRKNYPMTSANKITPEEKDALLQIKLLLKSWNIPNDLNHLNLYIQSIS